MSNRSLIVLSLSLLLTSLTFAQDLGKPVTYRTVAIPLRQALEQISLQAGVKLTVSDELGSEPIILCLRGASTKDTMDHVATAVGAKWTDRGKGEYLLERTPAMAEKLEQEAVTKRADVIKKSIDRLSADMAADKRTPQEMATSVAGSFASEMKRFEQNRGSGRDTRMVVAHMPAHRALVRLLKLMRPEDLAALEDGEKAVYSTKPSPMQKALPEGTDQIGEQFQQEQNLFANQFAKDHPAPLTVNRDRYQVDVDPMPAPPAKLLVFVGVDFGIRSVTLIAVDPRGRAVGSAAEALRIDSMETMQAKFQAVLAGEAKEPEIPLSPESALLTAACKAATDMIGNPPALSPEVRELVLHPVSRDPMSFLVSDAFLGVADQMQTNLIAYPCDDMAFVNFSKADSGNTFKLPSFLEGLDQEGMEITSDKGWTVSSPQDRIEAWRTRTDREAYEKCLQEADSKGYVSIPLAAELAFTVRSASEPMIPGAIGLLSERYNPFFGRDIHALKFYASLSPGQVAYLVGGAKLPSSEMSQQQWALFQQVAYQARGQVSVAGPGTDTGEYGDPGTYVLVREPTEFIPEGLPPDATVSMTSKNSDLIFVNTKYEGGWEWVADLTIDQIAYEIATDQGKAGTKPSILWLAPGVSHDLTMTFDLTPTRKRVATMREIVRSDARWTLDNLPPDLKNKLDAAVVKAKAQLDTTTDSTPQPEAQPPR